MGDIYKARLQPVGIESDVEEDETILDAAFRQGIALPHGCKEGQCSACKCILLEGETELLKYSTFALNDFERESGHVLMCRTLAYSDIEIELLNFDEEVLPKSIPVKDYVGKIVDFKALTHDICGVEVEIDSPMKLWAGQYVDFTVITVNEESITRSFSMANYPAEAQKLSFIIKKYPGGRFSGELESGGIKMGAIVKITGPNGMCFRREDRQGPVILVGAGSGMSPVWSILNDQLASGEDRPVLFFYGARTQVDLFKQDEIADLLSAKSSVEFIPVLSHADDDATWSGERGFVHECVERRIKAMELNGE
ncbi:unnamed protein product, partial [Cyprideis torosa]